MSWGEIKVVNSDFATPINIAILINHIDLIGSNYIGRFDLNTTKRLLGTSAIYAHPIALSIVSPDFWDYIFNSSSQAGKDINEAFGLGSSLLPTLTTGTLVLNNAQAMWEIGRNPKAAMSIVSCAAPFNIVAQKSGFASGLLGNKQAMDVILLRTTDPSLLPISILRNTTTFNELHNASNLVKLVTVGTGSYTVPAGVNLITAVVISGGGAGGSGGITAGTKSGGDGGGDGGLGGITSGYSGSAGLAGGGGGGSGSYKMQTLAVTPGQVIPYTVAAGGLTNGASGGESLFGSAKGTKYGLSQNYILPNISAGGANSPSYGGTPGVAGGGDGGNGVNSGGGGGGGGYGGGNGVGTGGGVGGGTYGTSGGGGVGTGYDASYPGRGGGGYGGGGGGVGGQTGGTGGVGGQGAIAIYLGRSTLS